MAITRTTLAGAMSATDTVANLTSVTGVTTPNFQTASGITWLRIDQEWMLVTFVPSTGTLVSVLRGQLGTPSQAHVVNSMVQIGAPADVSQSSANFNAGLLVGATIAQLNLPAVELNGSADAIPAGVAQFYIVKTGGVDAMTLAAPTQAQEGNIIGVYSDTTNAHTITATSLLANGTAIKTTATFAAFKGAGVLLRCTNLVYTVLSSTGITFS